MSNHQNHSRNGSQSRLTCEPCRERKVKCNRAFPSCSRCTRLGFSCSYRDRISHRASQSAIISQLQERVRETEALLALQSSGTKLFNDDFMALPPMSPSFKAPSSPSPKTCLTPSTYEGKNRTDSVVVPTTSEFNMAWFTGTTLDDALGSIPATLEMDMDIIPDSYQRQEWPQLSDDWLTSGTSEASLPSLPASIITTKDLNELHQVFFNQIHPVMPIISKSRFYKDLQESPNAVAVKSVSYTVALLATTVPETHASLKDSCYSLARHYVDECEIEGGFNSLWCINFLQALLLLTRFEINNRSCARAWLTLGRAVRLAKIMRLDQIDRAGGTRQSNISLPEIQLPATHNVIELEERRRCLWALYILEGLASVYTGSPGILEDARLQVVLPSAGDLDPAFKPSSLPTLNEVQSIGKAEVLTPFCGLVLVVSVLRKVFEHTTEPLSTPSLESHWNVPGFWDRHYSLLKLVRIREALIEPMTLPRTLYSDAVAFNLYLVFHAVKIKLYEAAIEESERQGLPATTIADNVNQLTANALKIATAVRSSWGHQRFSCDNLSLSGAFVGWPLYIAIKALTRGAAPDQKRSRASTIQMLHDSLDDVELSDGPWHKLLSQLSPSLRPWERHL